MFNEKVRDRGERGVRVASKVHPIILRTGFRGFLGNGSPSVGSPSEVDVSEGFGGCQSQASTGLRCVCSVEVSEALIKYYGI